MRNAHCIKECINAGGDYKTWSGCYHPDVEEQETSRKWEEKILQIVNADISVVEKIH